MNMNAKFKNIIAIETRNMNHIHLFLNDDGTAWMAYGKSAVNLQILIPELKGEEALISIADGYTQLFHVKINSEIAQHYNLPTMCTLLGDDYIELTMPKNLNH